MKFKIKGDTKQDTLENISVATIAAATIMILVGVVVGTFVSGIPVLIGILGTFVLLAGIGLLIISEIWRAVK